MNSCRWFLVGLLALASCRPVLPGAEGGFIWEPQAVSLGERPAGVRKELSARWRVGPRSVELDSIKPSCACTSVQLESDGVPVAAGPLGAGAAGTARIVLNPEQAAGPGGASIHAVWRHPAESRQEVSKLGVEWTVVPVFDVGPGALVRTDLAPGTVVPFTLVWRALRPGVTGTPAAESNDARIRILRTEAAVAADGLCRFEVSGEIRQASLTDSLVAASVTLCGISPEPPPVKVRAGYRPMVERHPAGILVLKRATDGKLRGRCSLQFAKEAASTEIAAATIEPDSPNARMAVSWMAGPDRTVEVAVEGTLEENQRTVAGVMRLTVAAVGELVVRWVFVS